LIIWIVRVLRRPGEFILVQPYSARTSRRFQEIYTLYGENSSRDGKFFSYFANGYPCNLQYILIEHMRGYGINTSINNSFL
jgi:hypothetical protein